MRPASSTLRRLGAPVVLCLAFTGASAQAATSTNLVQNGSFESFHDCYNCWNGIPGHQDSWAARSIRGYVAYSGAYETGGATTWGPSMDYWTSGATGGDNWALTAGMATGGWYDTSGNTLKLSGNVTASPDGGNFVANSVSMSTSVAGLTVGQTYAVSFYEAVTSLSTYTVPSANALAGNTVTFGDQSQTSDMLPLKQGSFSGWNLETLYFTADAATQTLNFQTTYQNVTGGTPGLVFVLLDGVKVSASALPVPEPSSALMLAAGMFGLVGLRLHGRRRGRTQG